MAKKKLKVIKKEGVNDALHPDHSEQLVRLKRIRGQVEGIERMVVEHRYCPDIMIQIRSASAALKSVESLMFERHLRHCVRQAFANKDPGAVEAKTNELIALFNK